MLTTQHDETTATATAAPTPVDETKLHELLGRAVVDFGAVSNAPLVLLGDRLGLFRALAAGPLTPAELAARTQTAERYVREWLNAQAASGYVSYDAATGRYYLTPEQAMAFADENSPAFLIGAFQLALAAGRIESRLEAAFRSGEGIGWHEHDHGMFHGVERFFRTGYNAYLVQEWIPAIAGMEARLLAGARVADVGCGHGASTIIMAQAYPRSTFVGYDYHPASIDVARQRAAAAGVADRVRFEIARAQDFPEGGFDFVTSFDCVHDMGDPVGAAKRVRQALAPDGAWMIVEPLAGDRVEDNLHPVGRAYYAASTLICTPGSLAQDVGLALGAQAGEARLAAVIYEGGFGRFRRATQTPFNLILEARL